MNIYPPFMSLQPGYHRGARMAKLAKAAPLKGAAPKGACGFESRSGHFLLCLAILFG